MEKALRGVPGVSDARVQLLTESAEVTSENGSPSKGELIGAVRAAGYDAEVVQPTQTLINESDEKEKLRRHRQALVQAIGLVLPILFLEHFHHDMWASSRTSDLLFRFTEIVLFIMLAVSPAGAPILAGGWQAILHRAGNMDLLITMGVGVAFLSSLYGVAVHNDGFIHIHAAAMILGLVCVGRYLEARAKAQAAMAMKRLAHRAPRMAMVQRGNEFKEIPVEDVVVDDVVRVPPHGVIPTDGEVAGSAVSIDESLMTGEPLPLARNKDDRVLGGSVVVEGVLDYRATAPGNRSTMRRILDLVAAAQSGRTQMQQLADRVAAIFTPIVLVISAIVFVSWLVVGGSPTDAVRSAVAVLVVACPCALGLATPVVVLAASGAAALKGILVRDAEMLESLGRINTVVWDKTGSLTSGTPSLVGVETNGVIDEAELLRVTASAEQMSVHPLARALVYESKKREIPLEISNDFRSIPGRGIAAIVGGRKIVAGNSALLSERQIQEPRHNKTMLNQQMEILVAVEGQYAGRILFDDTIRPSSKEAVMQLEQLGVENRLLTGDSENRARNIVSELGIDHFQAQATPEGKTEYLAKLRREGLRAAMVGDGVNDAAALAVADVGIAFASGSELAGQAAGVHLVGSSPLLVPEAVRLARQSLRIIRENLFWAFIYNILMIPLAAMGKLPPAWAAAAMMISSLTVVLNALRIRK